MARTNLDGVAGRTCMEGECVSILMFVFPTSHPPKFVSTEECLNFWLSVVMYIYDTIISGNGICYMCKYKRSCANKKVSTYRDVGSKLESPLFFSIIGLTIYNPGEGEVNRKRT